MKQYVVDAFTDQLFHGNQAAICILDHWIAEETMMNIAKENKAGLEETGRNIRYDFFEAIFKRR